MKCLKCKKCGKIKKEIRIPIYFRQDEETEEVFIDEESIYDELKQKLKEIEEAPENFLEI